MPDTNWIFRQAPGEDDLARRVAVLRERLNERIDTVAVPDLKSVNASTRGSATARAPAPDTVELTWPRIVHGASSTEWSGRLLYRAALAARARSAIEVGTGAGLGSCWIAAGLARNGGSALSCLDGAPALLEATVDHIQEIAGFTPETRAGMFWDSVPALEHELPDDSVDLLFIDSEHYYDSTMRDADCLLPKLRDGGLAIFDDISWNDEMERVWAEIAQRPDCAAAIEPRHRGSRRLGIFVKGRRESGRVHVVDDAPGPAVLWAGARRMHHRLAR